MGSGRRKVSWTLCFLLLLLLEAASTKNLWKRALPSRLAERARVSAQVGGLLGAGGRWAILAPHTRAGQGRRLYLNRAKVGWAGRWTSQPSKGSVPGNREARGP